MMHTRKRVRTALLALTAVAAVLPFLSTPTASAAGSLQGSLGMTPTSGTSATPFTLNLPAGAACAGDSANDGYNVTSYMVPASVDPSTLQFDPLTGPMPQGLGAAFRQPLYEVGSGSAFTGRQTANATTPPGPGPIINIPQFDLSSAGFAPGDIPAGAYNVGIACVLGGPDADQMHEFWNTTMTVTTNPSGGPAQVSFSQGATPSAPTITTVTPGDQTLTVAFTPVPSTPATTQFTATATPTGGGAAVTQTGAGSPITVGGLTNGTSYDVTVHATNSVGNSPQSAVVTGTPAAAPRPAVTSLQATPGAPGSGIVNVSWAPPASGPAPTGYLVTVAPSAGTTVTSTGPTSAAVSGLDSDTLYTFTVTPQHPAPDTAIAASVQASPLPDAVLQQELTVTRPVGVLVLTQVCGTNGAIPAEAAGGGFPAFTAVPADLTGTGPTLTAGGSDTDPNFTNGEYPYPAAPNYPTHCGVSLGTAKLITSGTGAGQFFQASGLLNQVTVVDTRDTDTGWTINGTVGTFSAGTGLTFSGSQLGWNPVTTDTGAFTSSDGTVYDQVVTAGPAVAPNTPVATGLSSGRTLGSAPAGDGLGIATLDARLKLLIPVWAFSGNYTGTLTISSI